MNLFKRKNKYQIKVRTGREWSPKKIAIVSAIWLIILTSGLYEVNQFFNHKTFVFKAPAEVKFNTPISIIDRITDITVEIIQADGLPLTDDERYLCKVFGDQCKTALEVQRRENPRGDCEAFYVNNNGTVDFGFMQVNTVHLGKEVTIAQLVDCKSNIDIAYEVYKKSGWNAWVAYKKVKN